MYWGYWQRQKRGTEKRGGMEEALGRKELKVNAKKTEVMLCTRQVRAEADYI